MRVLSQAFVAALTLLSCASVPHPTTSVREQDAGLPQGTDGRSAAVAAGAPERAPMQDSTRIPVGVSPVRGRADALVTVVVFGDYQDPFCRVAAGRLNALRERYGDDLRVVWKDFPLPYHDNAMSAAEAARAVYEQGGPSAFWSFHEMLLENQSNLSRDDLERYAARVGVDLGSFRAALDAHAHRPRIEADMALARQLGVPSPPHLFINGTSLIRTRGESLATAVDAVLARARSIEPRIHAYEAMVADPVALPDPPVAPAPGGHP